MDKLSQYFRKDATPQDIQTYMETITIAQLNALLTGFAVFPNEGFERIENPVYC